MERAQSEQHELVGTAEALQTEQVEALAAERAAKEALAQVTMHGLLVAHDLRDSTKIFCVSQLRSNSFLLLWSRKQPQSTALMQRDSAHAAGRTR